MISELRPWRLLERVVAFVILDGEREVALIEKPYHLNEHPQATYDANLIALAPDHALLGWAMCVLDGRWEEWFDCGGEGEFVFGGLRFATRLDQCGCAVLTPALREELLAGFNDWKARNQNQPLTRAG
jgi:hypothetical protein